MPIVERGVPLVQSVIARLKSRTAAAPATARSPKPAVVTGASRATLDALESKLMVELPPTLRAFLEFDYTFASFGERWKGTARFGPDARTPRPRITSVRKLAEAKTDLGWTDSRIKGKVVRLPSLPGQPWNALYLGEARRDGELVILGIDNEDTNVRVYARYSAFDLYLIDQCRIGHLSDSQRLEDLESHIALNPELNPHEEDDDGEGDY